MQERDKDSLSQEDKTLLLDVARKTIAAVTAGKRPGPFAAKSALLLQKRGAFVTLHEEGELRGCIGYVRAMKPLLETVVEMAEAAALHDPRFNPVQSREVEHLHIEISVLSPMRRAASPEEVVPGVHGVMVEKDYHSGLLLPQVAPEQNWDREELLNHTCLKAGLPKGAWREPDITIYTFTADVFSEPLPHDSQG